MSRAASTTLASTHPAALAVHSGSVTDTPRPECAGEMKRTGVSTPALIECCSGTATTGPNSNDPMFLHLSVATNSETSWSPSRPWSNATIGVGSCLQGSVKPVEHSHQVSKAVPYTGLHATCRHLETGQLYDSKAGRASR